MLDGLVSSHPLIISFLLCRPNVCRPNGFRPKEAAPPIEPCYANKVSKVQLFFDPSFQPRNAREEIHNISDKFFSKFYEIIKNFL
jgi:hypothetical protein